MIWTPMQEETIIVVSGLPRSGTSLMMQILQAAGIEILTDHLRKADEHNPRGYFEFEPVRHLPEKSDWLAQAKGKALKIISHLLPYLPDDYRYDIIFMNRDLDEIVDSQNKMLEKLKQDPGSLSRERLKLQYARHLLNIHQWMRQKDNLRSLDITYGQLIAQPEPVLKKLADFLKLKTEPTKLQNLIDAGLYRSRRIS